MSLYLRKLNEEGRRKGCCTGEGGIMWWEDLPIIVRKKELIHPR